MNNIEESLHDNFRVFFDQHYQRLCSYAFSFLKEEESCEDVVQDIFIKIWLNRQDLIGTDQLKFYVFSALRNNCLTMLQKNKKYRIVEMNDDEEGEEILSNPTQTTSESRRWSLTNGQPS